MQAIDTFLETWNKRDKPSEGPLTNTQSRKYNNLNVVLSQSARNGRTVRINHIVSNKKRKGEMKKFLRWMAAQADKGGFDLTMAAQPIIRHYEDGVPKEKLKETAESFGFEERFEYPDGLGYEMIRHPANK